MFFLRLRELTSLTVAPESQSHCDAVLIATLRPRQTASVPEAAPAHKRTAAILNGWRVVKHKLEERPQGTHRRL